MSVLIKGMEMPTDNTILLRIYPENDGVLYVEQLDIDDDILDKYWAVPIPPHGRLIDSYALEDELGHFCEDYWVFNTVWHAPTIIEAEVEA